MFKEIGQIASMMKQLQGLGGRMQEMKERLAAKRCTGSSANGSVQIEMDGSSRTLDCMVSQELLDSRDRLQLQALIVEAVNDAQEKVRAAAADEMKDIVGGAEAMPGLMKMLGMGT
ncbi:MAG: YbaB/EbfC family nucleoid-associated protein [Planctomycetaceae bacterium]|nr:YbaB/EbfC family nucleoid-associated protein [Planctomycetaceae bacterium]